MAPAAITFRLIPGQSFPRPATVVPISEAEEPEEETAEDEAERAGALPVFSKPQRLRGGARPRPKELPAAASKLRVTSDSEIEYSGTICDGILFLEFKVPKPDGQARQSEIYFRTVMLSERKHTLALSMIATLLRLCARHARRNFLFLPSIWSRCIRPRKNFS